MNIPIQLLVSEPDPTSSFAADELRRFVGDSDPSVESPSAIDLHLVNSTDREMPAAGVHDGYCLRGSNGQLELTAVQSRGLLNGAYDILRLLGFSFPFPGSDQPPAAPNWRAVKAHANGQWRIPSFRHRILHFDNMRLTPQMIDWIGKLRINMVQQPLHVFKKDIGAKPELLNMLQERGIELNVGCHGFDNWLPPKRYGKDHPLWYGTSHAVRRGEFYEADDDKIPGEYTSGQLCLSNREMIREFAANMSTFLCEHPQVRTISLWPNDGYGGWCTCDNCLALEPDPNRLDLQTGSPSRSASYLWFIGQVGRIVHAQIPDARIELSAFYDHATPPADLSVVPTEDYYLGFLLDDYFGCLLHGHGESWNRDRIEAAHRKWREVFPGEIYALGYYADLYKVMDIPIVFTTKIRQDFAYLKDELGIDSVSTLVVCANLEYLLNFHFPNIYSYAALAWDHRQTSESLLSQLASAICPEKPTALFDYFSTWDNLGAHHPDKHGGWLWIEHDKADDNPLWASVSHYLLADELIDDATFAQLEASLAQAHADAADNAVARQVLESMTRAFVIFSKMRSISRMTCEEERAIHLKELRKLVSPRGFPAGTLALLNKWENKNGRVTTLF